MTRISYMNTNQKIHAGIFFYDALNHDTDIAVTMTAAIGADNFGWSMYLVNGMKTTAYDTAEAGASGTSRTVTNDYTDGGITWGCFSYAHNATLGSWTAGGISEDYDQVVESSSGNRNTQMGGYLIESGSGSGKTYTASCTNNYQNALTVAHFEAA